MVVMLMIKTGVEAVMEMVLSRIIVSTSCSVSRIREVGRERERKREIKRVKRCHPAVRLRERVAADKMIRVLRGIRLLWSAAVVVFHPRPRAGSSSTRSASCSFVRSCV